MIDPPQQKRRKRCGQRSGLLGAPSLGQGSKELSILLLPQELAFQEARTAIRFQNSADLQTGL